MLPGCILNSPQHQSASGADAQIHLIIQTHCDKLTLAARFFVCAAFEGGKRDGFENKRATLCEIVQSRSQWSEQSAMQSALIQVWKIRKQFADKTWVDFHMAAAKRNYNKEPQSWHYVQY